MRQTIFLSRPDKDSYTKITSAEGDRANLGCIEHDGHLNIKPELWEMIRTAGGDFSLESEYTQSEKTHGVAGTGYHSYAKFETPESAARYLGQFFDVSGSA